MNESEKENRRKEDHMKLRGKKIGVALTGSFCTYEKAFAQLRKLKEEGAEIVTIFSDAAQRTDSRFGRAEEFMKEAEEITGSAPLLTIDQAEPIGPKSLLDLLIILPCTGNTSVYRQYCGEAGKRHHGLARPYGGKGASAERKTASDLYIDK